MTPQELELVDRWHVLFDELCHRAGFHDTASLAGLAAMALRQASLRNLFVGPAPPRRCSLRILGGAGSSEPSAA